MLCYTVDLHPARPPPIIARSASSPRNPMRQECGPVGFSLFPRLGHVGRLRGGCGCLLCMCGCVCDVWVGVCVCVCVCVCATCTVTYNTVHTIYWPSRLQLALAVEKSSSSSFRLHIISAERLIRTARSHMPLIYRLAAAAAFSAAASPRHLAISTLEHSTLICPKPKSPYYYCLTPPNSNPP